jgi:hypothetical protein
MRLSLGALAVLAAFAALVRAGEHAGPATSHLAASECDQLVKELVYPGKPPFKGAYVFPEKLDLRTVRAKQKRVKAAYDRLSDNIDVALPVLVEHADDNRLSYVFEDVGTSGVITKASVGWACCEIVEAHVEVYRRHLTRLDFASSPRSPSFIAACGGIRRWWKARKGKPLAELQLETAEWASRQGRPKLFESDEEWEETRRAVQKMAADIRVSGRPILVEHHVDFFGK